MEYASWCIVQLVSVVCAKQFLKAYEYAAWCRSNDQACDDSEVWHHFKTSPCWATTWVTGGTRNKTIETVHLYTQFLFCGWALCFYSFRSLTCKLPCNCHRTLSRSRFSGSCSPRWQQNIPNKMRQMKRWRVYSHFVSELMLAKTMVMLCCIEC